MAMTMSTALNGSLANATTNKRSESYESNLDGLLSGASSLVRRTNSLMAMATSMASVEFGHGASIAKTHVKVLSDTMQSQVLATAVHRALPSIKAALSRWLSELHMDHTCFPLEKPGEPSPFWLYSLEYLRPAEGDEMPPPDSLIEHMEVELFDIHRPPSDEKSTSASSDESAASSSSLIDREISRVRIIASFSPGKHGEGEDASCFPGVVARGRNCWCPSVLVSGRRFQIECKMRAWWQMQTGLLRVALLDVPQLEWRGGAGVYLLGPDGTQRIWRAPQFIALQLGNRFVERALFDEFGMHNPITIPIKLWTPRGSLGYLAPSLTFDHEAWPPPSEEPPPASEEAPTRKKAAPPPDFVSEETQPADASAATRERVDTNTAILNGGSDEEIFSKDNEIARNGLNLW